MTQTDSEYFVRRAAEHRNLAKESDEEASRIHQALAELYEQRARLPVASEPQS